MNKPSKILLIILGSLAGAVLIFYGLVCLFLDGAMVGMGLADTIVVLNEKKGVELGRYFDVDSELPDLQLETNFVSIENDIYVYRVIDSYVYTVNKNNRYTVYDFENCTLICQTYDLSQMDKIHKRIFEDKSRFTDIIHPYITKENKKSDMYPTIELGDGMIYLEYNSLLDEYFLRSKIFDGEVIEFTPTEKMTTGLPVDFIRKYKMHAPYICVIDCNGKRTLVNYQTYECVYSEYIDKNATGIDLNTFMDTDSFIDIQAEFKANE